jgi:hypothetical protein
MKFTAEFKFTSLAMVSFFAVSSPLFCSFEPLPIGGRAAGMGEATSAIVDDVFSVYYNPAGVLQMNRPEIGTYYSQIYPGLTDNSQISRMFLGYGQPVGEHGKYGSLAVSYMSMELPSLYKEESMGVTYGREWHHRWNMGGTVKMLRKQIGSNQYTNNAIDPNTGNSTGMADPVLANNRSASALGLDLGVQYRLNQSYALGLAARNANNPSLGLAGSKDNAPAVYTAALARKWRSGSLDFEVTKWNSVSDNLKLALGGEHWFDNGFGLRAGAATASRNVASVSFGASYKTQSFQIDYATVYPLQGVQGTLGIQQVSLSLRLGKSPVDPVEQQLIQEREARVRAELEARKDKAEIDRLKTQLYELTQAKSQSDQEAERRAAQFALKEAQDAEAHDKAAAHKGNTQAKAALTSYTNAVADYNARVAQGLTLQEKRRVLEKIMADFANKSVDLSTVERELRGLKTDEAKAKRDFDLSMSFYRRLVQQGASMDERRSMLERIVQKYKGAGVEITSAEDEIKQLK